MNKLFILLSLLLLSVSSYSQTTAIDYYNRGLSKYNLKDYRGAISDYSKSIELNPKDETSYYNRGLSKAELKDYIGAIEDYTKAIELNPQYGDAYLVRGISKLFIKEKNSGCLDLSKAGEFGIIKAYDLIKEYCK